MLRYMGRVFNNWTDQDGVTVPTLMLSAKGHQRKQAVLI